MEQISKIGQYEIIREIGRGGMGVVYLAKHPTLGIEVALKAMYPDPSRSKDDPEVMEARKRFKNEAKITARLKDPYIVNVLDFGIDEKSGILFIVMDYLDGGTLKEKIAQKAEFTLQEIMEIIKPIAKALTKIHKEGIIHRDLKPSNIIFMNDTPIITDFGISRDVFKGTIQTETGRLVGSVSYMSPERITGGEFDHRADIFSLGVICYELFTGLNPFRGDGLPEISHNIIKHYPPLLSESVPNIPLPIANMVHKMLVKEPENRLSILNGLLEFSVSSMEMKSSDEHGILAHSIGHTDDYEHSRSVYLDRGDAGKNEPRTKIPEHIKRQMNELKQQRAINLRKILITSSIILFIILAIILAFSPGMGNAVPV